MDKIVNVWYDPEGDFLEVLFEKKAGFFRATDHEAILEKVDAEGTVIGFSIQNISSLKQEPPILAQLKTNRAA
ncbi:MAG: DUF2283 domain-containing protein [Cytophagaceae bacterium]|nr:DUF2283 domain-containing protein [Cytophagaceae bacterium]